MKVGLFGPKMSGKTVIFNSASGDSIAVGLSVPEVHKNTVIVPDKRIDRLSEIFTPKKTVYAKIEFVDVPGFEDQPDKKIDNMIMEALRDSDIICLVLDYFDFDNMLSNKTPDPANDYLSLISEMILRDMLIVENKLERMKKSKKTPEAEIEMKVFEKLRAGFEEEKTITAIGLDEDELKTISGYGFLTHKKQMVVLNISEDKVENISEIEKEYADSFPGCGTPIVVCGTLESEIASLPEEEQLDFANEMGLAEPGRNLLIRKAYEQLDLISFFTMGPDEVRAWTIKKGMCAKAAAGTIHSDLERGFIKGDIITYDDFNECGSEAVAKEKKLYRLEGATYEMKDGDIMEVRFNV